MATIQRMRRSVLTYLITLLGGVGFILGVSERDARAQDVSSPKGKTIQGADSRTISIAPENRYNARESNATLRDSNIYARDSRVVIANAGIPADAVASQEISVQQQEIMVKMEELRQMINALQEKLDSLQK